MQTLGSKVKKVLVVLLGNLIYAIAVAYFVLPSGVITGGTTGIAVFLNHYCGVSVNAVVTVFNILMFVLGALILGREFAATTLLSTFAYPVFLSLCQNLAAYTGLLTQNDMLCTIFGGGLIGLGIALVIGEGASTGGMDIPPLVIHKWTGVSVAVLLYGFDVLILLAQMIFTDGEKILYGILLVCLYSFILEKFLVMGRSRVQVMVISREYRAINDMILHRFDRGTTLFEVEGGYTGQELYAVLSVINQRELFPVTEQIKKLDPEAFLIIGQVKEVRGHGFTSRKVYPEQT